MYLQRLEVVCGKDSEEFIRMFLKCGVEDMNVLVRKISNFQIQHVLNLEKRECSEKHLNKASNKEEYEEETDFKK